MSVSAQNRKNIELAISKLKNNFRKNNSSNNWANNIVSASKHLSGEVEWAHFYHFLADPTNYNIDSIILGEQCCENVDLAQDERFETVIYKNGNETVIHLKRIEEEVEEKNQEDEKSPE